nr:hypothetical protein [Tanacetum cinerariifolium]
TALVSALKMYKVMCRGVVKSVLLQSHGPT